MRVALACVAFAFGALGGAWSGPLIGGTIAYVQGTEAYEIYVVDVGVGKPRRVWREEDDRITSVKLSPDGQRVAFEAGRVGRSELHIVNVDGTGYTQVTNFDRPGSLGGATWSPDGTLLAFGSANEWRRGVGGRGGCSYPKRRRLPGVSG
jgi:Tol biopolymer transport system component